MDSVVLYCVVHLSFGFFNIGLDKLCKLLYYSYILV
jgi:hypothetical protein